MHYNLQTGIIGLAEWKPINHLKPVVILNIKPIGSGEMTKKWT